MHNEIYDVVFYAWICMCMIMIMLTKTAQTIQIMKIWIITTKHSANLNKMETPTRENDRDESKSSSSEQINCGWEILGEDATNQSWHTLQGERALLKDNQPNMPRIEKNLLGIQISQHCREYHAKMGDNLAKEKDQYCSEPNTSIRRQTLQGECKR